MNKKTDTEMMGIISPFLLKKVGIRLQTGYMIWGKIIGINQQGIQIRDKSKKLHYVDYKIIMEISDTYDETKGMQK